MAIDLTSRSAVIKLNPTPKFKIVEYDGEGVFGKTPEEDYTHHWEIFATPYSMSQTQADRLVDILRENHLTSGTFKIVPSDYTLQESKEHFTMMDHHIWYGIIGEDPIAKTNPATVAPPL